MYRHEQIKLLIENFLPKQEQYYLIRKGKEYALFGKSIQPNEHGLLVFPNLERAEQFCMTIANRAGVLHSKVSVPERVSAERLHVEVRKVGGVCVVEGLQVFVAALRHDVDMMAK
jgi:hypothetical protein